MSEASTENKVQEPDYLNMSDEEIRNMTGPVASTARTCRAGLGKVQTRV